MTTYRILVVDDDTSWLEQVPEVLGPGFHIDAYQSIDQGLAAIGQQSYDVLLLDLNFDGDSRSGLEVFRHVYAVDADIDIIVVSGETDHRRLIDAFNAGVSRFIPKMSSAAEIRDQIASVLSDRTVRMRAQSDCPALATLVGSSSAMQKVRRDLAGFIKADTKDVLIVGETGTGKEVAARILASSRGQRLVVVHCGAVSEGLAESEFFGHIRGAFTGAERDRQGAFEAAGDGFVFLDEIGEMPLSQQAKLLRVLQERVVQPVGSYIERRVQFRCIAATNVDLSGAVEAGRFRQDLYYRIAKHVVCLPPLRERLEDVPELVASFLQEHRPRRLEVTPEAIAMLQQYPWPGNVRQLRAVLDAMFYRADSGVIRARDVYRAIPDLKVLPRSTRLKQHEVGRHTATLIEERQRFQAAIVSAHGDRERAAQILGISRATFFRRAKELGLVRERTSRATQTAIETRS